MGLDEGKNLATAQHIGSNRWDFTEVAKIRAALNRNRKAMGHMGKRKFKHFQKYTSTCICSKERPVDSTVRHISARHILVRQRS